VNDAPLSSIHYRLSGVALEQASRVFVWGHGWGQSGQVFAPMAESLPQAAHILLDFPGFGASPLPPAHWGVADYADACAALLDTLPLPGKEVIWVGHSFGGRVGVSLVARYPGKITKLCLVAAAGLKRRRPWYQKLRSGIQVAFFKTLRRLPWHLAWVERMKSRMGSADYRNAGAMRPVFVRVVNEDLAATALQIRCPTLLIYGGRDTETPPSMGEDYAHLIPQVRFLLAPDADHYSLLGAHRAIVMKWIKEFTGC